MTAVHDEVAEARLRCALAEIAARVRGLALPGFRALVLGGGYGRGEGGVTAGHGPYNDLDFFVLSDAPERTFPEMARRLRPVSEALGGQLGVDVDFVFRSAGRLRHDASRLMVQELLHGYVPVLPSVFDLAAWSGVRERDAAELPAMEAARLLLNRGMGLELARRRLAERGGVADGFVLRNVNKAVLGAGDARLIASGRYAWRLDRRESALASAAYSRACAFKRRPSECPDEVPTWEEALSLWRQAAEDLQARRGGELRGRSVRQLLRWFWRRRSVGPVATLGLDCTMRVFVELAAFLGGEVPETVIRDWEVFN